MSSSQKLYYAVSALPSVIGIAVPAYALYCVSKDTFRIKEECVKKAYNGNLDYSFNEGTEKILHELSQKFVHFYLPENLAKMRYYCTNKSSIQINGTAQADQGIYIGIPSHFMYDKPADVDMTAIKQSLSLNTMNSDHFTSLRDSLVLSDNAKKFAIASAVHYGNNKFYHVNIDILPLFLVGFATEITVGKIYPMIHLQPMKRLTLISVLFVALTAIHVGIVKFNDMKLLAKSDKIASEMGREYFDGGLEYFDKTMEKNRILLKLVPSLEWVHLKKDGNEIGVYMPLSERRRLLLESKTTKTEIEA